MINPNDLREGQQVVLCSVNEALERNEGPGIDDEMNKFFDGEVLTILKAGKEFRILEDDEWVFHVDWIDKIVNDKYAYFDREEVDKFLRLGLKL